MPKTITTAEMLGRACELGERIEAILGDTKLQRLSREAWVRQALELGGYADEAAIEADVARLATMPYLRREVSNRAQIFAQHRQDRPASWSGFSTVSDDASAAAYSERLALGLTGEQCSAIACYLTAQMAAPNFFGTLGSFGEREAMLVPLTTELGELDRQLTAEARVADLSFQGDRAYFALPGSRLMPLAGEVVGRLASAAAEMVQVQMRQNLAA